MKVTLESLVQNCWPELVAGIDWIALSFNGKNDLEKQIPTKMNQWNYGDPHFVILRDQDGADCLKVKEQLREKAEGSGKPFSVRVVCNELESWFLGELNAVEAAFPASKASKLRGRSKFRDPDRLTNASDELQKLVQVSGKVSRAKAIAEHFKPEACVSRSFLVLWKKVAELMPSA